MLEPFFITSTLEAIDFSKAPSSWLADVVRGNFKATDNRDQFPREYAARLLRERAIK